MAKRTITPAADEETTVEHLGVMTGMLCNLIVAWLPTIGIEYSFDPDRGEACYWTAAHY